MRHRPPLRLSLGPALLAAALLVLRAAPSAAEVLLIKSGSVAAYDAALEGFRRAFGGPFQTVSLDRDEPLPPGAELVVAIGSKALKKALELPREVPVVFLLCLNPDAGALRGRGHVGIDPAVPPADYLALVARHFPALQRVGILTGSPEAAGELGRLGGPVRTLVEPVRDASEVPSRLEKLLGAADALLLLPDPKVLTKETTELILRRSLEARKPAFAYSAALVSSGAFLSLAAPYDRMGEQAGEIARGGAAALRKSAETRAPRDREITVNETTAARLGIAIPAELQAARAGR